ncbi:MAG: hypothetical protein LBC12_01560 [Nitrososphaerota archaeon]|nr:hypothetical protein [Nitrososphaerota archaeon]
MTVYPRKRFSTCHPYIKGIHGGKCEINNCEPVISDVQGIVRGRKKRRMESAKRVEAYIMTKPQNHINKLNKNKKWIIITSTIIIIIALLVFLAYTYRPTQNTPPQNTLTPALTPTPTPTTTATTTPTTAPTLTPTPTLTPEPTPTATQTPESEIDPEPTPTRQD